MQSIYADAGTAMAPCKRREACIELSVVRRRINDVLQFIFVAKILQFFTITYT